jgi:signal transduction histidine kinase
MDSAAHALAVEPSADVVEAYREETRSLVATRFPVAAGIFLALMAVAYTIEWLYHPERTGWLLLCYAAFVVVVLATRSPLRRHPRHAIGIALGGSVTLALVMAAYLAMVQRSAELTLLAMIGFLTGIVVQFPWGARGQSVAVAGVVGVYLLALQVGAEPTLPVPYGLFALASHALMTIVGAQLLDEFRWRAFREAATAARHAAESQRANAAKSEFLATVSHELRTPLNIIVGYTDLLREGELSEPHERRDALGRIHGQSLHLLELIQSMLDLNRMEAAGVTLLLDECSIGSVLEAVRSGLPARWLRPGVELRFEPGDLALTMHTDRRKLETVLRNLIHNACKYTERGVITVSAAVERDRGWVDFAVTDTGQGIAPGDLSEIFEMFRQGTTGSPRDGGVGIGLYIVRQLTGALGGRVTVTSELGTGSRFTIAVPLRAPGRSGPG